MKSLLSFKVIVPSKSVKKMYLGFVNGHCMAFNSIDPILMTGQNNIVDCLFVFYVEICLHSQEIL